MEGSAIRQNNNHKILGWRRLKQVCALAAAYEPFWIGGYEIEGVSFHLQTLVVQTRIEAYQGNLWLTLATWNSIPVPGKTQFQHILSKYLLKLFEGLGPQARSF